MGNVRRWPVLSALLLVIATATAVVLPGLSASAAAGAAFSPSPYSYGTVTSGQTATKTFTLANSGSSATGALTITVAPASGTPSATFTKTADACTGTSLGPKKSCTVTVRFAPASAGSFTATLTAANNKKAVLATDTLTGTGAAVANTVTVTNPGNQASAQGSAVSLQIRASDSDSSQTLTYTATGLPTGLSINAATGLISGTPTTAGTYSSMVTATDGTGASGSASFTWAVSAPANTVTVTNPGNQTSAQGSAVSLQIQASDSDSSQTLTYSATGLPEGLSINAATGLITGTPTTTGTYSSMVTATDGTGASGSASFTWTVNPAAGPPTANPQSYSAVGNTSLAVGTTVTGPAATVAASGGLLNGDSGDASCGTLTVTGHTAPAHGTLPALNTDGTFTYLPAAGYTGTDTFQYTITCGSSGQTASNTVTITVSTLVWYVNNTAAAGGNGESSSMFSTLAAAEGAAGTNSIIFLYQGNATYTGGLTMQAGQRLYGQPHGLTADGYTLVAAGGSNPVITNSVGDGIDLASGVDIENVTVDGGSGATATGINGSEVTGNVTIANSTVTGSGDNNVVITDSTGNLNLTVTGSTFSDGGSNSGAGQGYGLNVNANGSTNATISVTGSTFTSNADTDFYLTSDTAASGTNSVTFSDNQVKGGGGVELDPGGTSTTTITIDGNNIQNIADNGIGIDNGTLPSTGATVTGTINGNTIGTPGVSKSGGGNGIGIFAEGTGTETIAITNNNLAEYYDFAGIYYIDREGSPALNLTITGNTLSDPAGSASLGGAWGILGDAGALSTDSGALCAAITGNSVTGSGQPSLGSPDIEVDQAGLATYKLPGYTGSQYDTSAVGTFIAGNNGDSAANVLATTNNTGPGFVGGSGCPAP